MSRKNYRSQPIISRDSSFENDYWFSEFEKKLQKSSVQPRRISDDSIADQINSIINNGRSKFTSVENAVKDMQERSGLTAYLKANAELSSDKPENIGKRAQAKEDKNTPIVFLKKPEIRKTFENFVEDSKGNVSVPATIDRIKSIHKRDVSEDKDWEDDNLIRYVSRLNLEAKKENPASYENDHNLGKRDVDSDSEIDRSNSDAFSGLNPVKF